MKTQKKTYTIKLSRTLIGFPKEKANRKMILHILKMAIIISSNYLIIHTHYKPISRKKSFYQKIKKNQFQEMIILVFFSVWKFAAQQFAKKRCLGTRKIIEEKKVDGPNGKKFTKLIMDSQYQWTNYEDIYHQSTYVGR